MIVALILGFSIVDFLMSKGIDVEFIEAPGEHTWEFCDEYIKKFIKTLI